MFENLTATAMPSLNALRAFEAMARTGGATRAAEELNVTHSAVSRQVKALEASLGLRLFAGPRHRLVLTPAGEELLAGLSEGFDHIAAAVLAARSRSDHLVIAAHTSLSVKWLIPRLPRFGAKNAGIGVELIELAPDAKRHRDAHAVLRIQDENAPGAIRIMPVLVGPVVAAGLEAQWQTLPRLVSRTHVAAWDEWRACGGEPLAPAPSKSFAHLHVTLDAAVAGLGVAVLPWPVVADDVAAGRLVAVGSFVPTGAVIGLSPSDREPSRALKRFASWLAAEGAAQPLP